MVNRIWQFRMGDGMVRTPNDFGTMGDKPESHALLDWLAAEFVSAQMERQGHRPPDRDQQPPTVNRPLPTPRRRRSIRRTASSGA